MRIVTVVGARPQFIKVSAVSRALARRGVDEVLVHTGQHFDGVLSEIFFTELQLPKPRYNLGVGGGTHGMQTGRMLEAIETVLLDERPDVVLVFGDTNSTLAGALAAAKLQIPVAHVEAGLRSFNRRMPEEVNRILTDHLAAALYAPTTAAVHNLHCEGIAGSRVQNVGDVMYDVARHYGELATEQSSLLRLRGLEDRPFVLATVHRQENTDDPSRLSSIFAGLRSLAAQISVILPLHPRTQKMLQSAGGRSMTGGIRVIEPVGYLDMIALEQRARLIVTDSGGVQKEAYFFGVPCITLRDETEWVELVDAGWNTLVPPTDGKEVARALIGALAHPKPADPRRDLYGDGNAAERVAELLLEQFAT